MNSIIKKTLAVLNNGGVILYPSDTVWGLACDATNTIAVKRIFEIKKRTLDKSVLVQVTDLKLLNKYAIVPDSIAEFLASLDEPTTVIYPYIQGLAGLVVAKDKTIAARIPKDEFSKLLLAKFKKPLVSTSANISTIPFPTTFDAIDKEIITQVDYVVPLGQKELMNQPSKIIKFVDGKIIEIR